MQIDFSKIAQATPDEIRELSGPLTRAHAEEAFKLGMAQALSERGILPSALESFLKTGENAIMDFVKAYPELAVGTGAAIGAGTGYLQYQAGKAIEGSEDPEFVKLRKKIDAYHNMSAGLRP